MDDVFLQECGIMAAERFAMQVKGIRIGELVSTLWVETDKGQFSAWRAC